MAQPLHILFVEDNPQDTELALRELRRAGFLPEWSRVETEAAFLAQLNPAPDVILSDFKMPQFDGLQALRLLLERKLEIPFIIVSGTIGEDTAVEAMKLGATDYLLKDRLARLGPAVQRALEQQRAHQQRKKAEEALRESENRLRQMMENINEVIWMTNPAKSLYLYISPAFENIWGRPRDQLYQSAQVWLDCIHPEDRARIRSAALIKQALGDYNEIYRIIRPDGTVRWIRDRAYPMRDETGQVYRLVGVAEDFSQQKQLEEKFLQAQRMEAIGTLAGGIAHDFNNILSGIVGFNSLARQAAAGNTELLDYLDEISRAGSRAADLVRQILAFSRTDHQALVPVQLRHIVAEAVQLLRAAVPSTINFEVNLSSNLPAVLGNATQLHQVLMNLGTNASHAMRDRPGQLRILLEHCLVDETLCRKLPDLSPGPFVRLTVSDTGCGIDAAIQKRVFEPFFTTKAPGEGTGLGLSVVHGIVRSHHGAIRLSSEVDHGTTFEIYLPAIAATPPMAVAEPAEIPHGHGERVLFVDDEMLLVRLGERTLLQFGYAVEGENQVLTALARLEQAPQAFQLVITDQTMPGLTGLEFARRVHALRADLPVMLMSGHSAALTPERIRDAGVCEVLLKPFSATTLVVGVQRNLKRPHTP
jgi:PAS domain S-box-containing protein